MTELLDRFVKEVAARTSDDGSLTKGDLRRAFEAATGEDAELSESGQGEEERAYEAWTAHMGIRRAAEPPRYADAEDQEYSAYAQRLGIVNPATLRGRAS